MIILGQETFGTIIAFVQLLDFVVTPVQSLGEVLANKKGAETLIEKTFNEIITSEEDQSDKTICDKFKEKIQFKNVSYKYNNSDNYALKDINLTFEKGKSYAIVGASGSGKSTLINMLLGYQNSYEGNIKIDSNELNKLDIDSLYKIITVIQQNVYIFDDTIRANITMNKKFDDRSLNDAIKNAGLKDFIFKKGLDYMCGENGKNLSGGEKQRISIARALLSKSEILLVDEATAALDTINSQKIIESIQSLNNTTRIVVTHKINESILKEFDNIIVMKNGRVEERGKYDYLYNEKGYFYSLINTISE